MGGIAGYFTYRASGEATEATTESSRRATQLYAKMYSVSREDYRPWREAGARALTELEAGYAAGPGEFVPEDQPGYRFGFENFIEKPYLSSQSTRGRRLSGETAKGLTRYASDYAETSYDNFLNRYYKRMNVPLAIAGLGQVATAGTVAAGTSTATSMGQNYMSTGQTLAGIQGGTMAAYGGIANQSAQNYMNFLQMQRLGVTGTTQTTGGSPAAYGGWTSGGSGATTYNQRPQPVY